MQAYADYLAGKLEDRDLDQTALDAAFAELPTLAGRIAVSSAVRVSAPIPMVPAELDGATGKVLGTARGD
jgi:hypothetical protein